MLRLTNKRREEASVKRALTLENEIELMGAAGRKGFRPKGTLHSLFQADAGGMLPLYGRYGCGARCFARRLYQNLHRFTFRGECALGTWVTRVMVTQAIDYLRRKHRFNNWW